MAGLYRNTESLTATLAALVMLAIGLAFGPAPTYAAERSAYLQCLRSELRLGHDTESRRENPYLSTIGGDHLLRDLQWRALQELAGHEGMPVELRDAAREKLNYFKTPFNRESPLDEALARVPADLRAHEALEFALTSFQTPGIDNRLSEAVIRALGQSPYSNTYTIERLLPVVRGVRAASPRHQRLANDAIKAITSRSRTFYTERFPLPNLAVRTDPQDILFHEPIERIEPLGGGVNETLVVYFRNGARAVFKPFDGEKDNHATLFSREVDAYDTVENWLKNRQARQAGLSRVVVPVTVEAILTHDGKSYGIGSLQLFLSGFETVRALQERDAKLWDKLRDSIEWKQVEARARAIDFWRGNHDRFPNHVHRDGNFKNIMIDYRGPQDFEVPLIDNGLGMPGRPEFGIENAPIRAHIPEDFARMVQEFDAPAFRKAKADHLPAQGIDDFLRRHDYLRHRLTRGP